MALEICWKRAHYERSEIDCPIKERDIVNIHQHHSLPKAAATTKSGVAQKGLGANQCCRKVGELREQGVDSDNKILRT